MPIKSSPAPLAISEIVTEFGDSAGGSDSLSEYYKGGDNVNDVATNSGIPTSGAIDVGDFYGAGNAVTVAASAGNNIDIAPLFPGTFTNAVSKILTIAAPIQITGNNVALTVPSNMSGTLDIQNAGNIIGSRGNGGNAGGAGAVGGNASAGGAAISIQKAGVTINNSGTISGGGGGGGGGAGGAPTSSTNTSQINFPGGNYSPTHQWEKLFGGAVFQNNRGKLVVPIGTINFSGGTGNTTQLNQTSGTGAPAQINRGTSLGDGVPNPKRHNVAGAFYTGTTTNTTAGGSGGGGGNGYGWNGSSIVNPESGGSGSSPGGANGGAGGGAGAAGTAGSNSPAASGGSAGAGGNSVTSPGSVNYTVSNTGTINGTQG